MVWVVLLRPVHRDITILAVAFVVVARVVQASSLVDLWATLFPLGEAGYRQAFTPEQLAAMSRLTARRTPTASASACSSAAASSSSPAT